ncbi:hypothetical protein ACKUV4_015520 [Acinetobacter baumannii]
MNKFLIIVILGCLLLGCGKTEQEKLNDERQKLDLQVQKIVRDVLKMVIQLSFVINGSYAVR